jgi:hypothetical protein
MAHAYLIKDSGSGRSGSWKKWGLGAMGLGLACLGCCLGPLLGAGLFAGAGFATLGGMPSMFLILLPVLLIASAAVYLLIRKSSSRITCTDVACGCRGNACSIEDRAVSARKGEA